MNVKDVRDGGGGGGGVLLIFKSPSVTRNGNLY